MSKPGLPKYVVILFATSVLFMSATFLPFLDSILFPNDEIARFVNALENRGEVPLDSENADTVVEQMKSTLGFMNKAIQVGCGYHRMVQYDLKRVKPPIKVSVTEYVYIAWFQKLQKPTLISVALYSSEAGQHAFQIRHADASSVSSSYGIPISLFAVSLFLICRRKSPAHEDEWKQRP
jgi:hypothetical protein